MSPRANGRVRLAVELRVMWRPRSTFAELRDDAGEGAWRLFARTALLLLAIGVGVSVVTAGRVTAQLVLGSMLAWSFAPVIQLIAATAGLRVAGAPAGRARWLAIYAAGNGPWLLLFTLLPFVMVLAPNKEAAVRVGIDAGGVPIVVGLALAYGAALTFAFHRSALGASRARAALATGADLGVKIALSLGWFGWMDNLVPQLFGAGS